jgi:hypothetical protein
MRILVAGDRFWTCPKLAASIVRRLVARYGVGITIIHGGAPGVDESFARACRALDVTSEPHVPDWKGLGNLSRPARNKEMVESGVNLCIALHRSITASKGTKDCIQQALAAGIPTYLIEDERAIARPMEIGDARLTSPRVG